MECLFIKLIRGMEPGLITERFARERAGRVPTFETSKMH
jgi:hypothetical protein